MRALHQAIQHARYTDRPERSSATRNVRACYMNIAASAIILAERATRPAELTRGQKSSTAKYSAPDFSVPDA